MNSNEGGPGLVEEFAAPVVNGQVKVKQFIPGPSLGMRKSNVRFVGDDVG